MRNEKPPKWIDLQFNIWKFVDRQGYDDGELFFKWLFEFFSHWKYGFCGDSALNGDVHEEGIAIEDNIYLVHGHFVSVNRPEIRIY